jgi:hypothetical protein
MHGGDLASMHEPLKRSRVNLEDSRRLMTVEQWLAVYSGSAIGCSCTRRWLFFVGHSDSLLHANPALLSHKRDSRFESHSSNEI